MPTFKMYANSRVWALTVSLPVAGGHALKDTVNTWLNSEVEFFPGSIYGETRYPWTRAMLYVKSAEIQTVLSGF
jgi:hypothetical protein